MIIFHEGLPGSGKSYEACINQIIPALKKGRHVYAYIEGINLQKFADVTGMALSIVTALLHPLTKEQVPDVQTHVADNSLVILDELQDFFPTSKNNLTPEITEFVTQHRHRGIDIVCMGQDHRDCHMLWKRRIDTLIQFTKRDAIGQSKSYTWATSKQKSGKFEQLRSGKGSYDPKFFGLYASHSNGVDSIDAHEDDRTNIFKGSVFTFWMPLFAAVLGVAIWYMYGFFHTAEVVKIPAKPAYISQPVQSVQQIQQANLSVDAKPVPPQPPPPPPAQSVEYGGFIEKCLQDYRLRLSGFIITSDKKRYNGKLDFYKEDRIQESFDLEEIKEFGYSIEIKKFGVIISKNGKFYPATSWPIDNAQNISRDQMPSIGHKI